MGRKPEKEVVKWLTAEELNEEIRKKIGSTNITFQNNTKQPR
jgi:hypothetical protein